MSVLSLRFLSLGQRDFRVIFEDFWRTSCWNGSSQASRRSLLWLFLRLVFFLRYYRRSVQEYDEHWNKTFQDRVGTNYCHSNGCKESKLKGRRLSREIFKEAPVTIQYCSIRIGWRITSIHKILENLESIRHAALPIRYWQSSLSQRVVLNCTRMEVEVRLTVALIASVRWEAL